MFKNIFFLIVCVVFSFAKLTRPTLARSSCKKTEVQSKKGHRRYADQTTDDEEKLEPELIPKGKNKKKNK